MKLFFAVFMFVILVGPAEMVAKADKILVHGHRGARAVFPENTLPAFRHAMDVGVDVLEMDLGVTKDKDPVLVVSHDSTINPTFCQYKDGSKVMGDMFIHQLSLEEVKRFDCGALKNPKFPKQQTVPNTEIPTLDEVFQMVAQYPSPLSKTVQFNIETKFVDGRPGLPVDPKVFAKLVVDKFKEFGVLDRVILQSFSYDTDYQVLKEVRKLAPTIRISALSDNPAENFVKTAQMLKADFISPYFPFVSPKLVAALNSVGAKLAPWTVNTPADWDKMIKAQVAAIITDDPEALIQYLKKNGAR